MLRLQPWLPGSGLLLCHGGSAVVHGARDLIADLGVDSAPASCMLLSTVHPLSHVVLSVSLR